MRVLLLAIAAALSACAQFAETRARPPLPGQGCAILSLEDQRTAMGKLFGIATIRVFIRSGSYSDVDQFLLSPRRSSARSTDYETPNSSGTVHVMFYEPGEYSVRGLLLNFQSVNSEIYATPPSWNVPFTVTLGTCTYVGRVSLLSARYEVAWQNKLADDMKHAIEHLPPEYKAATPNVGPGAAETKMARIR
jgi:hypothetical protein